jgi:chromosome segregation ATPase
MLKNQFDRVVGELEDATRREQNAYEENQRIDRLNADELQQEPNRTRLEAQQKAEQENTQRLEQLEKRMEQLLQGATRNGEIDKETMKQMAEAMKSLGELSRQDMPKVEKNLGESQQPNNTPEQAKKELKDALAEQKKVLEKMQQTLEQSRNANQNMEASTFINRLKKAASELDAIATSLIDSSEQAAGLSHLVADPRILSQLTKLDQQLSTNASDIRWIQEDLGHFFTRTNQPVYQKILDAMRDSSAGANIDGSLEGMRDLLKNNQTFRSIQTAAHWSGQLKSWAKMLDDSKDSGSSGGGGEGGGGNPEDEDFEFMLRVMKLIQKEQDLRNATRALEELKRSALLSP